MAIFWSVLMTTRAGSVRHALRQSATLVGVATLLGMLSPEAAAAQTGRIAATATVLPARPSQEALAAARTLAARPQSARTETRLATVHAAPGPAPSSPRERRVISIQYLRN